MSSHQAAYFVSCAAIVVASVVFVLPAFTTVPVIWYYPVAHAWALEGHPKGVVAIDWYGRTIWALLAAASTFPIGLLVARRIVAPSPRAYLLWAGWAGMTCLLAIAVYTYQLAHRHPVPEILPPGYQAR